MRNTAERFPFRCSFPALWSGVNPLPSGPFDFHKPLMRVGSPRRQSRQPRPRRPGPVDQPVPEAAAPPPAPPPVEPPPAVAPPDTPRPKDAAPVAPVEKPVAPPPPTPPPPPEAPPPPPPPGPGVLGEPACGWPWITAPAPLCGNGAPAAFPIGPRITKGSMKDRYDYDNMKQ